VREGGKTEFPVAGVIIAGGGSRRFGGGGKADARLGAETLAAFIIRRATAQVRWLALNSNAPPLACSIHIDHLQDSIGPGYGPLAGVLAGLEWAKAKPDQYTHMATFVVDAPFFPDDLVSRLSTRLIEADCDIVCAISGGRRHHLMALWPVSMAGALREALTGEGLRAVKDWLARWRVEEVEFPVSPYDPFFNINTQDDLKKAEEIRKRYFKESNQKAEP